MPQGTDHARYHAEQAQAPVFLRVGRTIVPHMGVRKAFEMTKRIAEESNAHFVIHLDLRRSKTTSRRRGALSRRRASTIWRFRAGIEAVWSKGGYQLEEAMAEGSTRMVAATIEKMKLDGCAAKAPR